MSGLSILRELNRQIDTLRQSSFHIRHSCNTLLVDNVMHDHLKISNESHPLSPTSVGSRREVDEARVLDQRANNLVTTKRLFYVQGFTYIVCTLGYIGICIVSICRTRDLQTAQVSSKIDPESDGYP